MNRLDSAHHAPHAAPYILLVEDEREVAEALSTVLDGAGYRTRHVDTAAAAQAAVEERAPDLIVLDLNLPDVDGLVLLSTLRSLGDTPVIICSGRDDQRERVLGLKLGADDYIVKPFDAYELQARVEAVLRRSHSVQPEPVAARRPDHDELQLGSLVIHRGRREATLNGEPFHLTPIEYRMLIALADQLDEVATREELARRVWGFDDVVEGRALDLHVLRLRAKLRDRAPKGPWIVTVRGFGYKLTLDPASA